MSELAEQNTHLRGTTLLVAGRTIALILNFAVQVLIVRALTKSDFGAFAYGLSFVAIATNLNILGLAKTVGKLFPQQDERGDTAALAGTTLAALTSLIGFGLFIVVSVYLAQGFLQNHMTQDQRSTEAVLWLIFLVPLQALDNLFQSSAAVFIGARAIFFRRHIVGPLLKLTAVGAVLTFGGELQTLALLYVLATAIGVLLYVSLLTTAFRKRGILASIRQGRITWPGWTLATLAIPLLTTDLVIALESNLAILLLEAWHGAERVASLRAIVPLVGLVLVITESFKFLYLPLASRLCERGDIPGMTSHYWRSFRWIVVFSFPVASLLFLFAPLITTTLFGERYADSAVLLMAMVPFQYCAAALGLNHYTITALGRGRFMLLSNLLALVIALVTAFTLIPPYGALGAALSVSLSLLAHQLIQLIGLRGTGILRFDRPTFSLFAQTVSVFLALASARQFIAQSTLMAAMTALLLVAAFLVILRVNRNVLQIGTTFPELTRLPIARWFVGVPA